MSLPPFHERNPHLLQEAKLLLDRERIFVGASTSGVQFYGLGSFHSQYLGREVYGGIKINFWYDDYFYNSLANVSLLDELCLDSRNLLPLFFGGIKIENKIEILMEDFSQNGTIRGEEMLTSDCSIIPASIKELMSISPYNELMRAFMHIGNNNFKMMDFDTIPWNDSYSEISSQRAWDFQTKEDKLNPYLILQ